MAEERQKKVVLFGGTTEGRRLVEYLEQARIPSAVCVATEYGRRVLGEKLSWCDIFAARMDAQQMERFLREADARVVIDATHPYAVEVTANISKACSHLDINLYRVVRESVPYPGQVVRADTAAEAVKYLTEQDGIVFITTGSKELEYFQNFPNAQERLFARILPTEPSIQMAEACGFGREQLILGTGPFSARENVEHLKQVRAKYLLTKDTGREGGFPEKMEAVERTGVIPVVIRRPAVEDGVSVEEMISILEEKFQNKV